MTQQSQKPTIHQHISFNTQPYEYTDSHFQSFFQARYATPFPCFFSSIFRTTPPMQNLNALWIYLGVYTPPPSNKTDERFKFLRYKCLFAGLPMWLMVSSFPRVDVLKIDVEGYAQWSTQHHGNGCSKFNFLALIYNFFWIVTWKKHLPPSRKFSPILPIHLF